MQINSRVRLAESEQIGKERLIDARAQWRSRPAFHVVRAGIGHYCRFNTRRTKSIERREHSLLYFDETYLETPPSAFYCRKNALFVHCGIDGVRHKPHCFDAIQNATKTPPQNIVVVVATVPLIGWNSENFGNRPFPNERRRWNTNERMK